MIGLQMTPLDAANNLSLIPVRNGTLEREWLVTELESMIEDCGYPDIVRDFIDKVHEGMRDAGTETLESNSIFAQGRGYLEVRMAYRMEALDLLIDLHVALTRADQVENQIGEQIDADAEVLTGETV